MHLSLWLHQQIQLNQAVKKISNLNWLCMNEPTDIMQPLLYPTLLWTGYANESVKQPQ